MKRIAARLKPSPPAIPYSSSSASLISEFTQLCYQQDVPRAMKALDVLESQRLWGDPLAYSQLLKSCFSRRDVPQAVRLQSHLLSSPQSTHSFLLNILLGVYVKLRHLPHARNLFDKMPERNVISWTTVISAHANVPDLSHKSLDYLVSMLRHGVTPNMFTYSSVLRACTSVSHLAQLHCSIFKHGLESDVFVRSALIDAYSNWGRLETALSVFDEMVTADLVVWNSIIAAFAHNSDGHKAMDLFKRMKRSGFMPEQSSLTSVLTACTSLALLELGRQVHVHVFKYDQDLILNNALLDMYCKCGSLEDANAIFTRMVDKDVISWSTMIAGLAQNGFSRQALELFESMKGSIIKPNYITLLGVLFACSHAGLVEDGWHYFRSMKKIYGIDPGREHYACMLDLLARAGKLQEAVELMDEMDFEPDVVMWRTLLDGCRVHKNVDLAMHAAEKIMKLNPEDAGSYIILSNIYANAQRWDEVAKIRKVMNEKGIRKEPGCSWVEVDKQIHAFILGDESHPQISDINAQLDLLIQRLIGAGYVPDTNFVLKDLEGEQREDSLRYHSEKLALMFGLMNLPKGQVIRIRKNLRICGDCHRFVKLVTKLEKRSIVIRDPIRYHHFSDGVCSCGDYW
ncbi:Pentatricopeptide repeat-containing protein At2g03880, mitochondrial [Linum perenne]